MPQIIHFEITSGDVDATARFYGQVFGWTAEPSPFMAGYTLLLGGPATGAVMSDSYRDQKVILWHQVDDIDAALKAVTDAGGTQAGEINTIPGQGRLAYAADIGGTIFGLRQPD